MVACLVILILTIAVLTTVNMGHTIHERVRLQNTADSAAYSMAAMEARAFNFYAFANRTQVSHYVSAMSWQSLLSFAYFTEAFLVDVYGMMKTISVCVHPSSYWTVFCPLLETVPAVAAFITFVTSAMGWFGRLVYSFVIRPLDIADPDRYVGRSIVPLYRVMNDVLGDASRATFLGALTHVTSVSADVVAQNDPDVDMRDPRLVSGLLSGCILSRAHQKQALDPFGMPHGLQPNATRDDDKIARAKRVMGAISNATRFACDKPGGGAWCGPGWLTSRKPEQVIPLPPGLGFVRDVLVAAPDWKWGQTKMLSYRNAVGRDVGGGGNRIRDWKDAPNAPTGMLAQGDAMGSDDIYEIKVGPSRVNIGPITIKNPFSCDQDDNPAECWGDPRRTRHPDATLPFRYMLETSIWSLPQSDAPSIHWRLVTAAGPWARGSRPLNADQPFLRLIGLNKKRFHYPDTHPFDLFHINVYSANIRGLEDGNHPWEGLAEFPHFEPGQFANACGNSVSATGVPLDRAATRAEEFNQPSTWALLTKNADQLQNPNDRSGAGNNKPRAAQPHRPAVDELFAAGGNARARQHPHGLFGQHGPARHLARPDVLPPPRQLGRAAQLLQPVLEAAARPGSAGGVFRAAGRRFHHHAAGAFSRAAAEDDHPLMRNRRGAAIVEFALVAPLLIGIVLFSLFLTELVRAKLKVQEASRFVTWEMTSYPLSNYGGTGANRNDDAFAVARTQALDDAMRRYRDLDSVDERASGMTVMAGYGGAHFTLENQTVPSTNQPFAASSASGGGPLVANFLGTLNPSTDWLYDRFGFDTKGRVQGEFSIVLDNRILPRHFLDGPRGLFSVDQWGGRNLQQVTLKSRFSMVVDGWALTDGADAEMHLDSPRAGVHRRGDTDHGLYTQVRRMSHFGISNSLATIPGLSQLTAIIQFTMPNPFDSAYVVAHNYGLAPPGSRQGLRQCWASDSHPAADGLNNLAVASVIDFDPATSRGACFDTAPFRDRASYDSSQYVEIFQARGGWAMGCSNPQADDPTVADAAPSNRGDRNNRKVDCGRGEGR